MSELDDLAESLEAVAAELEQAAAHAGTAAPHARDRQLPRIGAHGFAAHGHLRRAERMLDEIAADWADHATAE